MGKGFDVFMENPYWKKQYDEAPSQTLKDYYRLMFDTTQFIDDNPVDENTMEKKLCSLRFNAEDLMYLRKYAGMGMAKALYSRVLDSLRTESGEYRGTVSGPAFGAELRNPFYNPEKNPRSEL